MKQILIEKLDKKVNMYRVIKTAELVFSEELINSCKLNHCGKYNRSWMCPPAIGNQYNLINRYKSYKYVFVFSKIAYLEDPFDLEGMVQGRKETETVLKDIRPILKGCDYMTLGPGACTICKECTYPALPCRFPDIAIPSLEALGINVLELAKSCDIKYYNGPNTVTYFAAIFYN